MTAKKEQHPSGAAFLLTGQRAFFLKVMLIFGVYQKK
jgi:hypothetical protein